MWSENVMRWEQMMQWKGREQSDREWMEVGVIGFMGKGWIQRGVKEVGERRKEGKLLGRVGRQMDGDIIMMRKEERTGRQSKERRNRGNDTERWKQMGQNRTEKQRKWRKMEEEKGWGSDTREVNSSCVVLGMLMSIGCHEIASRHSWLSEDDAHRLWQSLANPMKSVRIYSIDCHIMFYKHSWLEDDISLWSCCLSGSSSSFFWCVIVKSTGCVTMTFSTHIRFPVRKKTLCWSPGLPGSITIPLASVVLFVQG